MMLEEQIFVYVKNNRQATNTQLFSLLALLNAYIPEAYLLMSECQKILGPPDPIHGGPPFEERMRPFINFIDTSSPSGRICMIDPVFAQTAVEELANSGISRSHTANTFMDLLCGDQLQPHTLQFIKDLLTKRELGGNGQEKFSRLIEDIRKKENFKKAVSVLKRASDKFRQNPIFPQTISRLHYIPNSDNTPFSSIIDYGKAEEWAKQAIQRAPNNSYVADTLGQIYKNRLMREAWRLEDILRMAKEAFKAFEDVEKKADEEEGPEMMDIYGTVNISNTFNNRGRFGFIQVAKIAFEKLKKVQSNPSQKLSFIQNLKTKVKVNFDFFEWYLIYSKPDMTSLEPHYFWKDIALCYELYTTKRAAESTSFPGLLDSLNHGLFTSKGRRAAFEEAEDTVSHLEAIRGYLKNTYEANVDDVKAAERYTLSNIILSNKMHSSPQITPLKELQAIIYRFLEKEKERRSPEFYLLVLLLFWPEGEAQDSEEEQETRGEPAQLSLDLMFGLDLQQYVTFMEKTFERTEYSKYLRGQYLMPLFFLGKGSGLSKWIHKSRLDAIVEEKVDADLAYDQHERTREKWRRINEMWINGDVWRVPEIEDMLLPVQVELCHSATMPQEHEEEGVFVYAEGKKIWAKTEVKPSVLNPRLFYLGFTIQGPVVFKVE